MSRNYYLTLLFAVALTCLAGCNGPSDGVATNAADGADQSANAPKVKVETSSGEFIITLQPDKAPKTVAQFIENVNNGVYNNSIVHNVVQGYNIMIGGVKSSTDYPEAKEIPNEATPDNSNKQWTVAMLHDLDKVESDSVEFIINMKDNVELDAQQGGAESPDTCGYCVFGIVTDGFKTLESINATPTMEKGEFEYAPVQDITITKMSVL